MMDMEEEGAVEEGVLWVTQGGPQAPQTRDVGFTGFIFLRPCVDVPHICFKKAKMVPNCDCLLHPRQRRED